MLFIFIGQYITSFVFVLFISILNSPFHKTYMTLCPFTSQWKEQRLSLQVIARMGFVQMQSATVGRERAFCAPAVYWLSGDESTISDCWRGSASTGGNHYLVILRGAHMRYAPSMRASGLSFLLKRVLLSHKDIGRKGLSAYSRNFCNRCQKEEMKRNLEKSLEKIKMHWLLTQRNKQKFLLPWNLPKCSPHREEEAADLWAPKGGQTPALRKS